MKKGHIFFISGVAGAGKNTAIKEIVKDKKLNIKHTLSYKTREPREGELVGVDYLKISIEEFKTMIDKGEFLEYNYVHNQSYYGTLYTDVMENGILSGVNILKEIDPLILPTLIAEKKISREDFTYIFLDIPIEMIRERMLSRGEDIFGDNFINRIESAKKEKKLTYLADYIIDASKSREEVYKQLRKIILNHITH